MVLFCHIVMVVNVDAEFDFLDGDDFLLFLRGPFLFFVLVEELAIVHDLADWRLCRWRDLYKVEPAFFCQFQRLEWRHDAQLPSLIIDHAHLARADAVIHSDKSFIDAGPPELFVKKSSKKYITRSTDFLRFWR